MQHIVLKYFKYFLNKYLYVLLLILYDINIFWNKLNTFQFESIL